MLISKITALVLVLVTVATLIGGVLLYSQSSQTKNNQNLFVDSSSSKLKLEFETLELAVTDQERQMGYMNRDSICAKCGMLFVFETSQLLSFWMKDTLVPLKIVFMDENGIISNSEIGIPKQTSPAVSSSKLAKYVLEVPANSPVDLKPGQTIDIQALLAKGVPHSSTKEIGDFK